jgi:hypothetical protein
MLTNHPGNTENMQRATGFASKIHLLGISFVNQKRSIASSLSVILPSLFHLLIEAFVYQAPLTSSKARVGAGAGVFLKLDSAARNINRPNIILIKDKFGSQK